MDEDYTARSQEMWARAFEAYIYDTLPGKNNYLVNDFVAAGRVGGKKAAKNMTPAQRSARARKAQAASVKARLANAKKGKA